jgi:hypothetical protein
MKNHWNFPVLCLSEFQYDFRTLIRISNLWGNPLEFSSFCLFNLYIIFQNTCPLTRDFGLFRTLSIPRRGTQIFRPPGISVYDPLFWKIHFFYSGSPLLYCAGSSLKPKPKLGAPGPVLSQKFRDRRC